MSEKIVDKDSNCIVEYIYTLGKAGERLKAEETPSGKVTEYKYDNLYRLVSEKTGIGKNITETSYTYDCVGNRLTKITGEDKTEYKYNNLNQLISKTVRYTSMMIMETLLKSLMKTEQDLHIHSIRKTD